MEDYEAYGQLRDRPLPAGQAGARGGAPQGAAAAPGPTIAVPRRRKHSHWLRNAVLLIVAYFVVAAATTVQPLTLPFTSIRLSAPFPGGAPLLFGLPNRPYTVLVIGLDRRPTETGASRTDTVLLLRIDPGSHKAAFLSIPRDTLMQVPNGDGTYTSDRINTAYVYNYSSKDKTAAPQGRGGHDRAQPRHQGRPLRDLRPVHRREADQRDGRRDGR